MPYAVSLPGRAVCSLSDPARYFPGFADHIARDACPRELAGEIAALDDAVVPVDAASRDHQRGRASVVPRGSDLRGGSLVRAEQDQFTILRIRGGGDLWVSECVITYDGVPTYAVSVMEFTGDLVTHETQYFADPFQAPAWRAALAERPPPCGCRSQGHPADKSWRAIPGVPHPRRVNATAKQALLFLWCAWAPTGAQAGIAWLSSRKSSRLCGQWLT